MGPTQVGKRARKTARTGGICDLKREKSNVLPYSLRSFWLADLQAETFRSVPSFEASKRVFLYLGIIVFDRPIGSFFLSYWNIITN